MSVEKPLFVSAFASTKDLLQGIRESGERGEKRDYLPDMKAFLELERIRWKTKVEQDSFDKPTLFAANHFRRLKTDRLSSPINVFLNTREAMVTTSLISVEAAKLTTRRISWLVEDEIRENFLSFRLADPSMQRAMAGCYDSIPVAKTRNGLRGFKKKLIETLGSDKNIGIYPEGKTNYVMKEADPSFKGVLKRLQDAGIDFQIVPVSIFFRLGLFEITFHQEIDSAGVLPAEITQKTMRSIASSLPDFAKSKSLW